MSKGFITLATGDERYFKLAVNLLRSYKLTSKVPLPFAILTDRYNHYTSEFDEVIILEKAKSSYIDKLSVMINCPFDETIFIDADCLAYADLNQYWDLYDFRYPVTCFGFAGPLDYQEGWFKRDDIGKYRDLVQFIPNLHGGMIFIRRGNTCKDMYRLAMEINEDYHKYNFKYFKKPADEPILALCMAIFNSPPIKEPTGREIIFYPTAKNFKADFLSGTNSCLKYGVLIENGLLVHWQNNITKRAVYKTEVAKMEMLFNRTLKAFNRNVKKNKTHFLKVKQYKIKTQSMIYHIEDFVHITIVKIKVKVYTLLHGNRQ